MVVVANDFQVPFHNQSALALFKLFLRREKHDWLTARQQSCQFVK